MTDPRRRNAATLAQRLLETLGRGAAIAVIASCVASAAAGAAEIGPDDDLCAALRAGAPDDELVLREGDYRAGCAVRRGGRPDRPLVIRAADPAKPPRLVYGAGPSVNMLEIRASDIVIRGLNFWGGRRDHDGIRVVSGHRITVEDCHFAEMGGVAVAATHTTVRHFTVRRNVILDSTATGMYFGCHDGSTCEHSDLLVERNYIHGVAAVNPEIGYGLQVKLNSSGIIRDNVIVDTKGPGIMVYGSRDLATTTLVERNVVRGSRTSSGIVVAGGPALIRNNVSAWNVEAGIGLENYHQRDLLRGVVIAHNTLYKNGRGGITAPTQGRVEVSILNNAVHAGSGTLALPAMRPGIRFVGNVDCTWVTCFANPDAMDFSPFPGSLLLGATLLRGEAVPREDLLGSPRGVPPAIGALEPGGGPIPLGVRP